MGGVKTAASTLMKTWIVAIAFVVVCGCSKRPATDPWAVDSLREETTRAYLVGASGDPRVGEYRFAFRNPFPDRSARFRIASKSCSCINAAVVPEELSASEQGQLTLEFPLSDKTHTHALAATLLVEPVAKPLNFLVRVPTFARIEAVPPPTCPQVSAPCQGNPRDIFDHRAFREFRGASHANR